MADEREVMDGSAEISSVLESVLVWCLEDAKTRLTAGEDVVPFTALAVGETLFTEEHEGDTVEDCFNSARRTVQHASGASAYGFCYDGFVELDEGERDAIIAEGGLPGELEAYAFGYVYERDAEGVPQFEDSYIFVGNAPNFMMGVSADEGDDLDGDYDLDDDYDLADYLADEPAQDDAGPGAAE